jgi:hypothetical protein
MKKYNQDITFYNLKEGYKTINKEKFRKLSYINIAKINRMYEEAKTYKYTKKEFKAFDNKLFARGILNIHFFDNDIKVLMNTSEANWKLIKKYIKSYINKTLKDKNLKVIDIDVSKTEFNNNSGAIQVDFIINRYTILKKTILINNSLLELTNDFNNSDKYILVKNIKEVLDIKNNILEEDIDDLFSNIMIEEDIEGFNDDMLMETEEISIEELLGEEIEFNITETLYDDSNKDITTILNEVILGEKNKDMPEEVIEEELSELDILKESMEEDSLIISYQGHTYDYSAKEEFHVLIKDINNIDTKEILSINDFFYETIIVSSLDKHNSKFIINKKDITLYNVKYITKDSKEDEELKDMLKIISSYEAIKYILNTSYYSIQVKSYAKPLYDSIIRDSFYCFLEHKAMQEEYDHYLIELNTTFFNSIDTKIKNNVGTEGKLSVINYKLELTTKEDTIIDIEINNASDLVYFISESIKNKVSYGILDDLNSINNMNTFHIFIRDIKYNINNIDLNIINNDLTNIFDKDKINISLDNEDDLVVILKQDIIEELKEGFVNLTVALDNKKEKLSNLFNIYIDSLGKFVETVNQTPIKDTPLKSNKKNSFVDIYTGEQGYTSDIKVIEVFNKSIKVFKEKLDKYKKEINNTYIEDFILNLKLNNNLLLTLTFGSLFYFIDKSKKVSKPKYNDIDNLLKYVANITDKKELEEYMYHSNIEVIAAVLYNNVLTDDIMKVIIERYKNSNELEQGFLEAMIFNKEI